MQKLRYYAAPKAETKTPPSSKAVHSEFLRTGRISRSREDWLPDERRYLSYEEVAARTGRRLERAAETTHERINGFHRSIKFPKIIFHRTLNNSPHLGYCHVTAARTNFAQYADVKWAFYIANFFAELGGQEVFFEQIKQNYGRMYFAVAITPAEEEGRLADRPQGARQRRALPAPTDPKLAHEERADARRATTRRCSKIIAKL